jgi:hypothetical protein
MRCHLILKNSGICTLRRLPRLYDLTFWIKFRYELRETISKIDECDTAATLFHKAFINFCSKELVCEEFSNDNQKFAF